MFLGVNMFYLYVTIHSKTMEKAILDRNVLCARSHLRRNRECNSPLIVFVSYERLFKKTA